jgi:hypothetical protein
MTILLEFDFICYSIHVGRVSLIWSLFCSSTPQLLLLPPARASSHGVRQSSAVSVRLGLAFSSGSAASPVNEVAHGPRLRCRPDSRLRAQAQVLRLWFRLHRRFGWGLAVGIVLANLVHAAMPVPVRDSSNSASKLRVLHCRSSNLNMFRPCSFARCIYIGMAVRMP